MDEYKHLKAQWEYLIKYAITEDAERYKLDKSKLSFDCYEGSHSCKIRITYNQQCVVQVSKHWFEINWMIKDGLPYATPYTQQIAQEVLRRLSEMATNATP